MKKVRNVSREYDLGRKAADKNVLDMQPIDLTAINRAAYTHGYAQALMDVADGKVKAPAPAWSP